MEVPPTHIEFTGHNGHNLSVVAAHAIVSYVPAVQTPLHVAFVAELIQKLPAGHGNDAIDLAGQNVPTTQVSLDVVFTQKLPAGQSRFDVVEARQYEPAVHVAFVAELIQ